MVEWAALIRIVVHINMIFFCFHAYFSSKSRRFLPLGLVFTFLLLIGVLWNDQPTVIYEIFTNLLDVEGYLTVNFWLYTAFILLVSHFIQLPHSKISEESLHIRLILVGITIGIFIHFISQFIEIEYDSIEMLFFSWLYIAFILIVLYSMQLLFSPDISDEPKFVHLILMGITSVILSHFFDEQAMGDDPFNFPIAFAVAAIYGWWSRKYLSSFLVGFFSISYIVSFHPPFILLLEPISNYIQGRQYWMIERVLLLCSIGIVAGLLGMAFSKWRRSKPVRKFIFPIMVIFTYIMGFIVYFLSSWWGLWGGFLNLLLGGIICVYIWDRSDQTDVKFVKRLRGKLSRPKEE